MDATITLDRVDTQAKRSHLALAPGVSANVFLGAGPFGRFVILGQKIESTCPSCCSLVLQGRCRSCHTHLDNWSQWSLSHRFWDGDDDELANKVARFLPYDPLTSIIAGREMADFLIEFNTNLGAVIGRHWAAGVDFEESCLLSTYRRRTFSYL